MAESPPKTDAFGPNAWLVDEMYDQFVEDPSSVSESWQEFFEDYRSDTDATPSAQDKSLPATGRTGDTGSVPAVKKDAPPPAAKAAPAPSGDGKAEPKVFATGEGMELPKADEAEQKA